ncbi:hypothetical protein WL88_26015 [Burkholderia diffusa]|uniref:Purine nucleoside phosphorylase n=1 Tax=Burkholderia diffusa TaxID=488732 RepID=A0AAW3PAX8_9BURK|nr:hypothetical protein [Burkholderia diffusa]KWF32794.1 hypothetical protein WL86_30060 [Burkholderia diffusa]KWF38718.1 hypothetical protein WL85_11200 [Burkholderia diffusa]KWF46763.1 hypothetical protein WL88_26015 [Burkholderia diffusa]KWF50667.1 hypothetical protein WL87_15905 [Burkholderia diffusa]
MERTMNKFASLMVSGAIAFGAITVAHAQDNAGSSPAATQQGSAVSSAAERKAARQRARAERKAARKQARTQRRAEMKKLEDSGYSPAANDANYPNSLQNAQKKAAAGTAASQ